MNIYIYTYITEYNNELKKRDEAYHLEQEIRQKNEKKRIEYAVKEYEYTCIYLHILTYVNLCIYTYIHVYIFTHIRV
jgi:hypothetical protein